MTKRELLVACASIYLSMIQDDKTNTILSTIWELRAEADKIIKGDEHLFRILQSVIESLLDKAAEEMIVYGNLDIYEFADCLQEIVDCVSQCGKDTCVNVYGYWDEYGFICKAVPV